MFHKILVRFTYLLLLQITILIKIIPTKKKKKNVDGSNLSEIEKEALVLQKYNAFMSKLNQGNFESQSTYGDLQTQVSYFLFFHFFLNKLIYSNSLMVPPRSKI